MYNASRKRKQPKVQLCLIRSGVKLNWAQLICPGDPKWSPQISLYLFPHQLCTFDRIIRILYIQWQAHHIVFVLHNIASHLIGTCLFRAPYLITCRWCFVVRCIIIYKTISSLTWSLRPFSTKCKTFIRSNRFDLCYGDRRMIRGRRRVRGGWCIKH
jgi:hypothetical protein